MSARWNACPSCRNEPEPGWIEMSDNGPVVPCYLCNPKSDRELEFEKAQLQRSARSALQREDNDDGR